MIGLVLATVAAVPLFVNAAHIPTASGDAGWLPGTWKGSSVCQVKDSPCHDEMAVYYVTEGPERDLFHIKMNKVVGSVEQTMGVIDCKTGAGNVSLECRTDCATTWSWKLDNDVLNGTLQYKGQLYRKIRLTRAK